MACRGLHLPHTICTIDQYQVIHILLQGEVLFHNTLLETKVLFMYIPFTFQVVSVITGRAPLPVAAVVNSIGTCSSRFRSGLGRLIVAEFKIKNPVPQTYPLIGFRKVWHIERQYLSKHSGQQSQNILPPSSF